MNLSRRTVIKGIGAGMACATVASRTATAKSTASVEADSFTVQIAHQWGKDGLAAVIKNTSPHSATITNINSVAADHGRFNFAALTEHNPLTLASNEEIHVPFHRMGTPATGFGHFDNRLQKKLRESLVISTARGTPRVTTTLNPRVV